MQGFTDQDAPDARRDHAVFALSAGFLSSIIRNEQQATLSTMLFNSDLSSAEVSRAINAMQMLFKGNADHEKAIGMLQKIADEHQNSTITNLVNEIEQETQEKLESAVGGSGVLPTAAEQET